MKINKKIIVAMCLMSMLSIGCSSNSKEDKENVSVENVEDVEDIENHIPYIDAHSGEIDNCIINERYENVKKEELTYDKKESKKGVEIELFYADSIKNDTSYEAILQGFTYFALTNPCDLTYDQAIELVKKILPDDIKQFDSKIDTEVDKEYIYYKSSKGNFRVGLCYGYEFNDDNVQVVNKDNIVGIDYSKEMK